MSEPFKVTGESCLSYIDRPIAFANKEYKGNAYYNIFETLVKPELSETNALQFKWTDAIALTKFDHNISKRKVGYVRYRYDDGGLEVVVLGDEQCYYHNDDECTNYYQTMELYGVQGYESDLVSLELSREDFQKAPDVLSGNILYQPSRNRSNCLMLDKDGFHNVPFDSMIPYEFNLDNHAGASQSFNRPMFNYQGNRMYMLTNDPSTTLIFGEGDKNLPVGTRMYFDQQKDPIRFIQGQLYQVFSMIASGGEQMCPATFQNSAALGIYFASSGTEITSGNLVSIPYNLILTNNLSYARAYLSNGTLPPDAFLYPLDWENLPSYEEPDPDDDGQDNNTPDDNSRDIDPFEITPPSYVPAQLSNYNWYWLSAPQFADFLFWFWHDISGSSTFENLISKIEGLFNDLGSSVLMCRYFPCDDNATRIGGLASTDEPLKVGMIQKAGTVPALANGTPPVVTIGHITVPRKYKSFVDLSPYSEVSVYLPFHGFVDLDMNIYCGHDLYVKAVYDHLSGTIQYFLLCDNKFITNTFVAKMAVDIPITLQTKNDRDSAIFNNVANAVSGLMGAGSTLATGNPIGLMVGANAIATAGQASAPLTVRGTVGESGAFYGSPKCYLIVRRPTISKPSTWKSEVGQMCGQSYHLDGRKNGLKGTGLTICYNPRITFKKPSDKIPAPLQQEIDEIYSLLEKGVIC